MKYPQIMLDIETLGKHSYAPIVQIGLVAFDLAAGVICPNEPTNILVKPDLHLQHADLSTVCFWLKQSDAARSAIFDADEKGRQPLDAAKHVLNFFQSMADENTELWAMPPEFDCTILGNFLDMCDASRPWKYNATRDLRTLESLAGKGKADRVKPTVLHNAAHDAHAQAQTAINYFHDLRWGK